MSHSEMIAAAYYVKIEGRIRGPFSTEVLASMLQRGKVGPLTEVSADRYVWFALERIGGPFAAGSPSAIIPLAADQPWSAAGSTALIPSPSSAVPPQGRELSPAPAIQGQCFYSIDGVEHGPVSFSILQQRATSGMLSPHDPVWVEGQPNWGPAGTLPGLMFVGRKSRWGGWVSQHPALAVCLSLSILVLLVGPLAFVFAKAGYEKRQRNAEIASHQKAIEELEKAAQEVERKFEKEKAESEQRRREALDRGVRLHELEIKLLQERDLLDERIHQSKLQNLRDERTQRQFDAVNTQLQDLKQQQEQAAADARAEAQRQAAADDERNRLLDDIKDENKRHNREVESKLRI